MILTTDDMSVGDLITVFRGPPISPTYEDPFTGAVITRTKTHDGSWKGDPMEVICIELPFIVCRFLQAHNARLGTHTFDTREWQFMRISREYVAAVVND